jgi:DNA-binding NarL/FixJ family response regulator
MSQAEAVAVALGGDRHHEWSRPRRESATTHAPEQDVAALVACGLSNSQIAAALVISARTVEKPA